MLGRGKKGGGSGRAERRNRPCTRDAPAETEPKDSFELFWGRARKVSSAFFIARFKSTKGALILFITIIKPGHRRYSGVRAPREAIKYL